MLRKIIADMLNSSKKVTIAKAALLKMLQNNYSASRSHGGTGTSLSVDRVAELLIKAESRYHCLYTDQV